MDGEKNAKDHKGLMHFFAANGVYASLTLTMLSINSIIRQYILTNLYLFFFSAVLLELVTAILLWLLHVRREKKSNSNPYLEGPIETLCIRFADLDDAAGMEDVYHEWFAPSLSIDDSEFMKLLVRKGHFRLAEAKFIQGGRRILGYYSVWPISRMTFESLVSGKMQERDMNADMIFDTNSGTADFLYIPEICAVKGSAAGPLLLRDAIGYIGELLKRHRQFAAVGAWAYTDVGRELAQRACMTRRQRNSGHKSEFFEVSRTDALKIRRPRNKFQADRVITY